MKQKLRVVILFLLSFTCHLGWSQTVHLWRDTSIKVFENNIQLKNAWAAGMNTAVFATIDLNGDGKMDLIEFESPSFRVNPFLNTGTNAIDPYVYAPEYAKLFPAELEGWVRSYDYDNDGDMDLFSYFNASIALYRNDFTPGAGLSFTLVTNSILSRYTPTTAPTNIYVSRVNAPALVDLENDGDMDILSFSISGSWVEHHKNLSMDSTGGPSNINFFNNVPRCWGYFVLAGNHNEAILPPVLPTCPLLPAAPFRFSNGSLSPRDLKGTYSQIVEKSSRHAGSSLLAFDKDGDGDKDILNGDILSPNLLYIENCGTPDSAWMCAQDTNYPVYDVPAYIKQVSGPHYFDGNNDGKNDLIVANFMSEGEDRNNVWFYRNTTNNQTNVFSKVKERWLVDGMIDVGTGAHPVFFDVDQDGKKDLLVSNDYFYNNNNEKAKIAYYRNTSSSNIAEYTLITDDYAGISSLNLLGVYLSFGDLDGDGDQDMLMGESDGGLIYFQNIAGAGNPCNFIFSQANYQSINIGDNAIPCLYDIDNDGLLDLIVGERTGVLNYYHNNGTATVPIFGYVSNTFGGVNVTKVNSYTGFSSPVFFNNGNGTELLVGSFSGYIYHYNNIDGNLSGTFNLVDSMYQGIFEPLIAAPAMTDVDGDGKFDLAVGSLAGGVVLYTQNYLFSSIAEQSSSAFFQLYPNPATDMVSLNLTKAAREKALVEIFDVRGELIRRFETLDNNINISIATMSDGLYLCKVKIGNNTFSQKLIKQ